MEGAPWGVGSLRRGWASESRSGHSLPLHLACVFSSVGFVLHGVVSVSANATVREKVWSCTEMHKYLNKFSVLRQNSLGAGWWELQREALPYLRKTVSFSEY